MLLAERAKNESERARYRNYRVYIGDHVTWTAPNKWFILRGTKSDARPYLETQGTRFLCPIGSWNLLFENKWIMDLIFLEFFALRSHRWLFKKYKSVNLVTFQNNNVRSFSFYLIHSPQDFKRIRFSRIVFSCHNLNFMKKISEIDDAEKEIGIKFIPFYYDCH